MPEISFAEEFGKAVRARGLSLDRLHVRLTGAGVPVSIATLSYWQSGRSKPTRTKSMRALVELERILRVRPGTLTAYLGNRASGVIPDPGPFLPEGEVTRGILDSLGLDPADGLVRVAGHDVTTIGGNRAEMTQRSRQIIRAEQSGVRRWPAILHQDSEVPAGATVDAIYFCSVGQIVTVLERNLSVVEMLLPRELSEGEHVMVEYEINWGQTRTPSFRFERYVSTAMRELVLQVNFDPGNTPKRIFRASRRNEDDDPLTLEDSNQDLPTFGGQVQSVWVDVDPGVYGLYWEWD